MIYALFILGFLLRIFSLNQSFWLDEAAQLIESIRPLSQQFDIAGDFWPPLYHLLLHFWLVFGRSEAIVRLSSVFLGMGSLWGMYLLTKELIDKKTALIVTGLLVFSPFHIWYSQEVRPYMLSVLLGIFTTYFLIKKNWVAYCISGILFVYSSYVAGFLLVTHGVYVYFFEKKAWNSWFKATIGVLIAFLLWLPALSKQLHIGTSLTQTLPGWSEAVSTPLIKALPLTFAKFILGRITFSNKLFYASVLITLGVLCSWLYKQGFKKNPLLIKKISLLCFFPIIGSFLVSLILPIYAPQRLLFCLPFFYLLLAVGIQTLNKLRWVMIGVLVLVSSYSIYQYNVNPQFQREKWREAIAYVESVPTPNTYVLFIFPDAFAPWQWYSKNIIPDLAIAPTFTVKKTELLGFSDTLMRVDKIYLFHYLSDLTDPEDLVSAFLKESGFVESDIKDFPGVGFVSTYEKTLASN